MSIDQFTRKVLGILQTHFPDRDFELGEEEGTIISGDTRFGTTNLYAEYANSGEDDEALEQGIQSNFTKIFSVLDTDGSIPDDFEDAKDRLRLQLISSEINVADRAITFPFAEDVLSSIVVDAPAGYAYVRKQDAERWEQSTFDLLEIARENLITAIQDTEMLVIPGPPKLCVFQTNDGYDAARILLEVVRCDLIEQLVEETGENASVLVGIPNRDFLIAWNEDAPEEMQENIRSQIIEDAQRQSHPLSELVYRVTRESIKIDR
ncbi:MAG: hypothetical protein AAF664_04665 [Planctomycetota bacterium]